MNRNPMLSITCVSGPQCPASVPVPGWPCVFRRRSGRRMTGWGGGGLVRQPKDKIMPLNMKKGVNRFMKGRPQGQRGRRRDQGAFVSLTKHLIRQWLEMRPDWMYTRHGQGGVRRGRRHRVKKMEED